MGWLNATIEYKNDKSDRPKESRLMRHNANKTPAPFVELDAGEYLIGLLMKAGPIKSAPMGGAQALDWGNLRDYDHFLTVKLGEEDAGLLVQMSEAFVTGMNEGASPFSMSPLERNSAD